MFQFLSSHSKLFSNGQLYFSEAIDQPHATFIFNNDTNTTYKELITSSNIIYSEYNYDSLVASYKGAIGALTISVKLLQKNTKTLNKTTSSEQSLENHLNNILMDITKLNLDINIINIDVDIDNQPKKLYYLSSLLKKNYDQLINIDQRKNAFELALLSSDIFNEYLTEYYQYFNDCYATLMHKFSLLSDLCSKYNDTIKINLIQLLKNASNLFASSLVIDHSCDIEVSNPFTIFKSIENLGQTSNYHNNTAVIHVNKDILYILFVNKSSSHDFHHEINLNRF